jgi:3'-5' exoribonuclease
MTLVLPSLLSGGRSIFVAVMQVRHIQVGASVAMPLLVRDAQLRPQRDGTTLLKLTLADRTGSMPAVVLEGVEEAGECCRTGEVVFVNGSLLVHERYGKRLVVEGVRPAADEEYERSQLIDGPARPVQMLVGDLRELVATIQNPHLRGLLDDLLGEGAEVWERFREWPAAKHYHQAYRHGLLEHAVTVAQAVSTISATFPGIDRDVAVTGALLHDIGKLDAYSIDGDAIEMTDDGRLFGEIALGYYRVRRAIEDRADLPTEVAQAVLHIILSHHGSLEHGSPVVPCTREETLVHMIDNLGGRLGSFDRIEKELPAGEEWSGFDRALGGGAYFAGRAETAEAA